jgi:endonuclease/exonuclease/phosphatase family metal-dependent hydrolase
MSTTVEEKVGQFASPLRHQLAPHFDALARFNSTAELEASPLYARLRSEITRVLESVERGDFSDPAQTNARINSETNAGPNSETRRRAPEARPDESGAVASGLIRAVAWNVERGSRLEGLVEALKGHRLLRGADVLLLTELDYGMARSGNRHVAREAASQLGMNYAFAPSYIALTKGNGAEIEAEGENTQGLHGNAVLSPHVIERAWSIALPNGKDKMRGTEKRLGSQRAVVADVVHPSGTFRAVSLHLDAHSSQRHRARQLRVVLDFLDTLTPRLPVLLGGDWNTSTYDSSRAAYSIAGFARRVMMGVGHVIENHYLRPDSWFERHLFRQLEQRGYRYRDLNETGAGTLHYDVRDLAANTNMADWVPRWCFWWIEWALRDYGGRCSLKLDWFAGRGIEPAARYPPRVVAGLRGPEGETLSDHDPIVLGFTLDARRAGRYSSEERAR